MQIKTISIPLDPQTARAYSAARADEKMKMQALVSLWLRELTAGELTAGELPLWSRCWTKQGARPKRAVLPLKSWIRF
jgi:hypothetical protein